MVRPLGAAAVSGTGRPSGDGSEIALAPLDAGGIMILMSYQERLAERIEELREEIFLWTRENPDYTPEEFDDRYWSRLSNVLTDCDWTGFGVVSESQQVPSRRRQKAHEQWLHHLELLLTNIRKGG